MAHTGKIELNKLNYDRAQEIVVFSLRRSLGAQAIVINGEVPLTIIDHAGLRFVAKAAVRQALLDAVDALADDDDVDLENRATRMSPAAGGTAVG
ncbi:MAG TPA: hypothetical protein VGO22_01715 [Pseudorhizobium sp.]|jgi:hypothetical protein|nr:hypothetical protein [Pseudorhizobium sp.]